MLWLCGSPPFDSVTSKPVYVHHTGSHWETNHKGISTVPTVEDWHSIMKSDLNIVLLTPSGGAGDEFWQLACFSWLQTAPLQGYYLPWYALEIIVADQISLCHEGCLSLQPFKYCMFPSATALDTSLSSCKRCCSLFFQPFFFCFPFSPLASILQAVPLWSRFSAVWNSRLKSICSCEQHPSRLHQ